MALMAMHYLGQKNEPINRMRLRSSPAFTCFSISRNLWFGSSSVFTSKPKPTVPITSMANLRFEKKLIEIVIKKTSFYDFHNKTFAHISKQIGVWRPINGQSITSLISIQRYSS